MPDAHREAGRLYAPAPALSVATRQDEQTLITGAEKGLQAQANQRKGAWVGIEKAGWGASELTIQISGGPDQRWSVPV